MSNLDTDANVEYDGSGVGTNGREMTSLSVELPSYADSCVARPTQLPGFSNPQYSMEETRRREGEGDEGLDGDDLPPPYSPGAFGQRDVFVAPPEYFAIFGQIREAREESSNHFVFLRKLCQILLNTIGCTVLLLVFMSIPIAVLALGIYFIGDCPAEPNIPIFLVVGGVSGALKNIALVFENIVKRTSHRFSPESARRLRYGKFTWRAVNLIFDLFLIAWIIAGSYWIYHIYREVDPDFKNCHETLYKFAFGVITSSYILFAMMCCCMCVCGVCFLPRHSDEEEEERSEGGEEGERSEGGEEREGGRDVSHSPTPHSDEDNNSPLPGDDQANTDRETNTCTQNGETNSIEENGGEIGIRCEDVEYRERGGSEEVLEGGGGRGVELSEEPPITDTMELNDITHGHRHGDSVFGERRQLPQGDLSLDDLEPLDIGECQQTPILSPRARQSVANKQGQPLSPRTTSV